MLFPMKNVLYFSISTFRSVCAVPNMAVFCTSLISYFPVMLLRYFLDDSEMVPVAPIVTGITLVFTCHRHCISIVGTSSPPPPPPPPPPLTRRCRHYSYYYYLNQGWELWHIWERRQMHAGFCGRTSRKEPLG